MRTGLSGKWFCQRRLSTLHSCGCGAAKVKVKVILSRNAYSSEIAVVSGQEAFATNQQDCAMAHITPQLCAVDKVPKLLVRALLTTMLQPTRGVNAASASTTLRRIVLLTQTEPLLPVICTPDQKLLCMGHNLQHRYTKLPSCFVSGCGSLDLPRPCDNASSRFAPWLRR